MLNEQIRELRNIRGISQIQLANKLGVTKQSVSNWENDNILPSIEMLVKIANFFEVSTDYLLGLDKKRTLDVENLTEIQISHIQLIVDDLRNAKII
ncbi:MAG: helix-turn-helix domain-containing protein [Treponema succinifaciens]|nr:MAG: helix-turn-helix domain-containing protein [Treponema succinifaciens]